MKISIFFRKIRSKYFKFFFNFPDDTVILDNLEKIIGTNKNVFVFPSPGSPWGYMFQRPQQIARVLSSLGYPVIYCIDGTFPEEPDWFVRGISEIEPNLYLYNDGKNNSLLASYSKQLIVWQYWPHQYQSINKYFSIGTRLIYDCIDHKDTFLQYKNLEEDFYSSLNRAGIILGTANSILDSLKESNHDAYFVPNGVNVEDFTILNLSQTRDAEKTDVINKIITIKEKSDYVIGYYGAIAEWMDMDTIEYCASKNPNWSFVLVGQNYPNIRLLKQSNIYFLERVNYTLIPQLLQQFDIAIIPFVINNITLNTSPVKLYEYMAGGKPIVSSKLPEIEKYDSVLIAEDKFEFEDKLHEAINLINDKAYLKTLKEEAENNTWLKRVDSVLNLMRDRGLLK